jgi:hypothetical protein
MNKYIWALKSGVLGYLLVIQFFEDTPGRRATMTIENEGQATDTKMN